MKKPTKSFFILYNALMMNLLITFFIHMVISEVVASFFFVFGLGFILSDFDFFYLCRWHTFNMVKAAIPSFKMFYFLMSYYKFWFVLFCINYVVINIPWLVLNICLFCVCFLFLYKKLKQLDGKKNSNVLLKLVVSLISALCVGFLYRFLVLHYITSVLQSGGALITILLCVFWLLMLIQVFPKKVVSIVLGVNKMLSTTSGNDMKYVVIGFVILLSILRKIIYLIM